MSDHAAQRDMKDPFTSALAYASAGIYVFPVYVKRLPTGKKDVRPAGLWRNISTTSAADIAAWWGPDGAHRSAGLGIDCGKSGIVVVDCDGVEGIANWFDLGAIVENCVTTISGGRHHYYREHPDHPIGNDQDGTVAEHVDVRGLGGFVIAPPTIGYEWAVPADWKALPTVPDAVVQPMSAKRKISATPAPDMSEKSNAVDEFFDEPTREFTPGQAMEFLRTARAKLEAAKPGQ